MPEQPVKPAPATPDLADAHDAYLDEVAAQQIAAETHQGGVAPIPTVKRPETSDHKPKVKKRPKPKVKTLTRKDTDGNQVPYGREVTLHGVTVTVLDSALGDFEVADSLSLIGEASEEYSALGDKADPELMEAAGGAVSPLLRRLVGFAGSREVLRALRRENEGDLQFEHAVEFIGDLITALSPNS